MDCLDNVSVVTESTATPPRYGILEGLKCAVLYTTDGSGKTWGATINDTLRERFDAALQDDKRFDTDIYAFVVQCAVQTFGSSGAICGLLDALLRTFDGERTRNLVNAIAFIAAGVVPGTVSDYDAFVADVTTTEPVTVKDAIAAFWDACVKTQTIESCTADLEYVVTISITNVSEALKRLAKAVLLQQVLRQLQGSPLSVVVHPDVDLVTYLQLEDIKASKVTANASQSEIKMDNGEKHKPRIGMDMASILSHFADMLNVPQGVFAVVSDYGYPTRQCRMPVDGSIGTFQTEYLPKNKAQGKFVLDYNEKTNPSYRLAVPSMSVTFLLPVGPEIVNLRAKQPVNTARSMRHVLNTTSLLGGNTIIAKAADDDDGDRFTDVLKTVQDAVINAFKHAVNTATDVEDSDRPTKKTRTDE